MKTIALAIASILIATAASAQSTNGNTNVSGSGATANIYSKGGKSGPASAIAPSVTSTLGSCVVYIPLGLSVTAFGASSGIPLQDRACGHREKARAILQVTGDRQAATNLLCMDREMRQALGAACGTRQVRTTQISSRTQVRGVPTTRHTASVVNGNAKLASCERRAKKDPSISCHAYR